MKKHIKFLLSVTFVFTAFLAATTVVGAQTYAGEAAAVKLVLDTAATNALTTGVAATGPLPAAGGNINLSTVSTTVGGGVVSLGDSTVFTNGAAGVANSQASVNTLDVSVLGVGVSADVVQSISNCACPTSACSGSSTVTGLVVGGLPVTVTGEVNQTVIVTVAGVELEVIINEQIISPGAITVNALHIRATVLATLVETDVIVAQAHSGVTCAIVPLSNLYSGRAYGVWLRDDLLLQSGVSAIISDTGFLPTSGGNITVDTVGAGLPPLLSSGTVESNTSGGLPGGSILTSQSDASVEDLAINIPLGLPLIPNVAIEAGVLQSQTQCNCSLTTPTCTGNAVLTDLAVSVGAINVPVVITGLPNQHLEIDLLGLGLVNLILDINNRTSAGPGDITAEALRVGLSVAGVTDLLVVVASSHSDIVCGLGPSAGEISISGRTLDAFGAPIANVRLTASDSGGTTRSVRSNQFGNYIFNELDAGETYFIDGGHKRHIFLPVTVTPSDDISGIDLIAQPVLPKPSDTKKGTR